MEVGWWRIDVLVNINTALAGITKPWAINTEEWSQSGMRFRGGHHNHQPPHTHLFPCSFLTSFWNSFHNRRSLIAPIAPIPPVPFPCYLFPFSVTTSSFPPHTDSLWITTFAQSLKSKIQIKWSTYHPHTLDGNIRHMLLFRNVA